MKVINLNTHSKSVLALSFLLFSINLGNVFDILGVKISWIAAILLLYFVFLEKSINLPKEDNSLKVLFYFFIFWALYGITQIIFVNNIRLAISWYLILAINVFICCLMIVLIETKKEFDFLLLVFSLSFFANIFGAYWELLSGKFIAVEFRLIQGYQGKVAGFIGNYNDFGSVFLLMAIVIFLIQFSNTNNWLVRGCYLLGVVASINLILVNGSRGGIYAILLMLLIIPFYIYNKFIKDYRLMFVVQTLTCIAIMIVTFLLINQYSLRELISILGTPSDYGSDLFRMKLIDDGLKAFVDSIFLGIGPGQSLTLNSMNIHNFYIEILAEYGLIIWTFIMWISFVIPFKSDKHNSAFINSLLKATSIALIAANLTASSTTKMRALWVFLIFVAIIKKKRVLSTNTK